MSADRRDMARRAACDVLANNEFPRLRREGCSLMRDLSAYSDSLCE
jgi:hypothetical protein